MCFEKKRFNFHFRAPRDHPLHVINEGQKYVSGALNCSQKIKTIYNLTLRMIMCATHNASGSQPKDLPKSSLSITNKFSNKDKHLSRLKSKQSNQQHPKKIKLKFWSCLRCQADEYIKFKKEGLNYYATLCQRMVKRK